MGSFWVRFGIVLESFWVRLGSVLGSFWNLFEIVLGSFWDRLGVEMPKRKNVHFHALHPRLPTSPLEGFSEPPVSGATSDARNWT